MQALLSAGALCNVTSDVTTWDRCNCKDDVQYKLEVECVLKRFITVLQSALLRSVHCSKYGRRASRHRKAAGEI